MSDPLSPDSSADLLARWQAGDQQAAAKLWWRYATQLIGLTRKWLSGEMARHLDPEDVVQSVYRSFFAVARSEAFVLRHSGHLWRLLVTITRHKLRDQVRRQGRLKRRPGGAAVTGLEGLEAELMTHQPTPAEAAALADELKLALAGLDAEQRRMVELRLQGYKLGEIAKASGHHERTVRRVLHRVREHLQQRCRECADS
jgi:RNA polymerase sigma-70 factor (ECF subfamily)